MADIADFGKPSFIYQYMFVILKVSTSGVQLSFNSQIYSQHDGIAMGPPVGPILANTFMGFIEAKIFLLLSTNFNILDTWTIILF